MCFVVDEQVEALSLFVALCLIAEPAAIMIASSRVLTGKDLVSSCGT
jgi:hypothetical protein